MDIHQIKYIKYKTKYHKLKNNLNNQSGSGTESNTDLTESSTDLTEPTYVEHVSEPWFTLISLGLKTVEGRKNKGRFKEMKVNDIVRWVNNDFGERSVLTRISSKAEYSTFEEYLLTEGLDKTLPGVKTLDFGLGIYFKYFTKEDEQTYGVVAIKLELIE
jgi:ASC-1-like (ASCH) protein